MRGRTPRLVTTFACSRYTTATSFPWSRKRPTFPSVNLTYTIMFSSRSSLRHIAHPSTADTILQFSVSESDTSRFSTFRTAAAVVVILNSFSCSVLFATSALWAKARIATKVAHFCRIGRNAHYFPHQHSRPALRRTLRITGRLLYHGHLLCIPHFPLHTTALCRSRTQGTPQRHFFSGSSPVKAQARAGLKAALEPCPCLLKGKAGKPCP